MKANELRRRFIDFFVSRGHSEIKSSSLIPENDPTVLFTTAGMHPLVPYLMGEVHPSGKRLVDVQKCVRTDDIDEVGDATHCTFFEMLGNWSLGDYFKKEAIQWSYEFLTLPPEKGGIGLDPSRLAVTCFAGDKDAPRDEEAAGAWESLGFKRYDRVGDEDKKLIFFYEKKKNWWGPAGHIGPCGPDTEMFYDTNPELAWNLHKPGASEESKKKYRLPDRPDQCHANCECGRYVEIWNDVFMQYNKMPDGSFEPLKQQNVDTGMGFERVLAILNAAPSHFETELFAPIMDKIAELSTGEKSVTAEEEIVSKRIIADHVRAAAFILGDPWGVTPSNTDQGYILRRLIRRAIRHGKKLGINENFTGAMAGIVINLYGETYSELVQKRERIIGELNNEEEKFKKTLESGLREMRKIWGIGDPGRKNIAAVDGENGFYIYETYGFPLEMIEEELIKNGFAIEKEVFRKSFEEAMKKHQALSRSGSEMKFAGGLADHSEETTKLHTATHLLHKALRIVLGDSVEQRGSNITAERLRFDFNWPQKVTPEQLKQVEDMVNEQIKRELPVSFEITTVEDAKSKGAIGLFENKYGEKVKVYTVGDFSREICGGPHVENTSELHSFRILKEEASSAGIRRIKAVVQ
jgi:alanyl-tRNA synthetase